MKEGILWVHFNFRRKKKPIQESMQSAWTWLTFWARVIKENKEERNENLHEERKTAKVPLRPSTFTNIFLCRCCNLKQWRASCWLRCKAVLSDLERFWMRRAFCKSRNFSQFPSVLYCYNLSTYNLRTFEIVEAITINLCIDRRYSNKPSNWGLGASNRVSRRKRRRGVANYA